LDIITAMTVGDLAIAVVDIAIVAFVVYKLFTLIRGTRAVQLLKGIVLLLLLTQVSGLLHLVTVHWILSNLQVGLVIALPIVFQPELRRALEQLGRGRLFGGSRSWLGGEDADRVVEAVVRAAEMLRRNRFGALIVMERTTGLNDVIETGVKIEGEVSAELLANIFQPNTPLHDGSVIIRSGKIMAAACFLPLTEAIYVRPALGSRHRAAMGVTEQSDAIAVVVSEETGTISIANGGKLIRNLDSKTLQEMLMALFQNPQTRHTLTQILARRKK
jgi:diadenylate cyclase